MTSTKWPEFNMDGKMELTREQNTWTASVDAGLTDTNKRIKFDKTLENNSDRTKKSFDVTARFQVPFKVRLWYYYLLP